MRKVFFFIFFVLVFSISQAVLTSAESELPIADELYRQDPVRLAMGPNMPISVPPQPASKQPKQVLPPPSKSQSDNFFVPTATGTQPTGIQPTLPQPAMIGREHGEPWSQPLHRPDKVSAQEPAEKKGEVSFKKAKGGISFNFDDADVFSVIQTIFGEVLKVNYIIDQKISGRVNFRTTTPIPHTEILPIMEIILRLNGIAIVQERSLYRIILLPDISKEPAPVRFGRGSESVEVKGVSIVQIIPLDFIDSAEMVSILTPLLTKGGVIMDIQGKNYLMIADTDANMKRLLQVVDIFDREEIEESTKPKVYVYPLQNSKADHLAEILQEIFLGGAKMLKTKKKVLARKTISARKRKTGKSPTRKQVLTAASLEEPLVTPGTKIFPDEITNSLIILTTPGDYTIIVEVIKKLDIVPRQVLIEVLVAEVTLVDELEFGIQWFLDSKFDLGRTALTGVAGFGEGDITPGSPGDLTTLFTGFTYAAIDSSDVIRGLLKTLASESMVKVLSSPHILVSDNMEAKIQVGDQVPVETGTSLSTGGTTVTSIQYKDTGSLLKVKPHINEGGLVSLEVTQEFSLVSGYVKDLYPIFSTRTVETHLVVQDGQTIVIGGLIQEDNTTARSGIPLLKDIPILGYLFGATEIKKKRTELIILITPHVIKSTNEAKIVTDEFMRKLKSLDDVLEPVSQRVSSEGIETEKDYSDDEFMKKLKDLGDILESDDRKE